jgi:hypothetical protein
MYTLSPQIVESLAYWLSKRGGDTLPKRSACDPLLEIPQIAPRLVIAERPRGTEAIRYRLIGTDIVAHRGVDLTGKYVDESTYGANWRSMYDPMDAALRRAEPTVGVALGRPQTDFRVGCESVHLPLADETGEPRFLMNVVIFCRPPGLAAQDMQMTVPLRLQNQALFVWRPMRDAKPGWEEAVRSSAPNASLDIALGAKA